MKVEERALTRAGRVAVDVENRASMGLVVVIGCSWEILDNAAGIKAEYAGYAGGCLS
jgi:hypothetical protein